jgi:hypothetical protein
MPTISRTGITNGGTIDASHITNIIDALDGTSTTTTIVASGSFSGSLVGSATSASFAVSSSRAVSSSFASSATSASFAVSASRAVTSSFATTASYALNAGSGGGGEYFTMHFFHNEKTNTTAGTDYYFGTYPAELVTSISRIGAVVPFAPCIVVSASINVYSSSGGAGANFKVNLISGSSILDAMANITTNGFVNSSAVAVGANISNPNTQLKINIQEQDDTSEVYVTSVELLLKKT